MIFTIDSVVYGNVSVIFDEEDFDKVMSKRWHLSKIGNDLYVLSSTHKERKHVKTYLHRYLMGEPKSKVVDHIDGNTLNNSKSNLRVTDKGGNNKNNKGKNNSNGYKGVVRDKRSFRAVITSDYKVYHGVRRKTAIQAAHDYDVLAIKHHGEFAALNFKKEKKEDVAVHVVVSQKKASNSTGFRGVYNYNTKSHAYFAKIVVDKKQIYLGRFNDKESAALAYNEAITKYGLPEHFLNKI